MWKEIDNSLVSEFEFADFTEAFGFMAKVALIAERMQHHPELTNTYNRLTIRLTTHDKGNKVTEKDREMAAEISKLTE